MHVALVSPFDPRPGSNGASKAHNGGVEQVFHQVSLRLAQRGHDVTMVCSTDADDGEREEEGVRFVRVRRRGTVFRAPVVDLARRVPEDADVVQVAATYPFTTDTVLRRAQRMDVPCVLDFHFEAHGAGWLTRVGAAWYRAKSASSYAHADAVLVRSREYGRSAKSLTRVPRAKWRVVPNGVDPARFHPDGGSHEGDYILFVGRLVPYKGLHVLLEALARKPPGLPLYIVGDGPLRSELETLALWLGVDAHFLGRVGDDRLPGLYRGARVTVLPSVNGQEAFGITLLESMACGTPVVASGLPGVRGVAALGGFVVPPNDPDVLAEAIEEAVQPDALPRGRALAQGVHERFSWDAVTDRVAAVYADVVSRTREGKGGAPLARTVGDPVL